MTWKVVSQEQLAALPSFQGLTTLGIKSVDDGSVSYGWGSDERLSQERIRIMESEANVLIRQINGLSPESELTN